MDSQLEDFVWALILVVVGLIILAIAIAVASGHCVLGDACSWGVPTAEPESIRTTATFGAEQFHLQLTAIAGE